MKVKEVRVTVGYTFSIEQYHPIKGEYSMVVELGDEDELESVQEEARAMAVCKLLDVLDDVSGVHKGIAQTGDLEPGSLRTDWEAVVDKKAEEAADDDDWMAD